MGVAVKGLGNLVWGGGRRRREKRDKARTKSKEEKEERKKVREKQKKKKKVCLKKFRMVTAYMKLSRAENNTGD